MINVTVTAIDGEASGSGAKRFEDDVLSHHPDVVTIDYGLNDRALGLARAKGAWQTMIEKTQARKVKILLVTPTPDLTTELDDAHDPLYQHAEQIRQLASKPLAQARRLRILCISRITPISAATPSSRTYCSIGSIQHPSR